MLKLCSICVNISSVWKTSSLSIIQETRRNAGHSKWANIKHIKALKDGQRAATFTKISRMMRVAIQEGKSTDPSQNMLLAQAIRQAKRSSMPAVSIQNVIKTASSSKELSKPAVIDLRGPGNCLIVLDILTENFGKTRTAISTTIKKLNAVYADGSSKHVFDQKGVIEAAASGVSVELATEHAIEAGAEDVMEQSSEGGKSQYKFICEMHSLHAVKTKLEEMKYEIRSACQEYVPHTLVTLSDAELEDVAQLFDKLEDNPDIVRLYDNIA